MTKTPSPSPYSYPDWQPPDALLSYSWVIDGRLAVGPAPRRYRTLVGLGFGGALNLQQDIEPGPLREAIPADFEVFRAPIADGVIGGIPELEEIERAVEGLKSLLDRGRAYVHCFAGVGRSPSVCIAYLARYQSFDFDAALRHVLDRHPPADPTEEQIEAVRAYLRRFAPQ